MAHQTGYGGSITLTGPDHGIVGIESWSLTTRNATHEAYAKQDPWKTKWVSAAEWEAQVTMLVQDNSAGDGFGVVSVYAATPEVTALTLVVNATDEWQLDSGTTPAGQGWVTDTSAESPLDGPVRLTYTITGTGGIKFVTV